MTTKQKLLLATGAVMLAAVGITGALASHAETSGAACPKTDCTKECPKECEPRPDCPGC